MALTEVETLNGIFSLSIIIIYTILGLIIISRYFKYKNKLFLYVGIFWIGMGEPWYGSALSFLYTLITGNALPLQFYILAANIFVPINLFLWIVATTQLMNLYITKKKVIQIIYAVFAIIIEALLIYFIIFAPNTLGELSGLVDIQYIGWLRYYLLSVLLTLLITGILIARNSSKSDQRDIRFKGYLICLGFVLFVLGSIFDTALPLNPISLPIVRIIVIMGGLVFFLGFLMPEKLKQHLLKKS